VGLRVQEIRSLHEIVAWPRKGKYRAVEEPEHPEDEGGWLAPPVKQPVVMEVDDNRAYR